eukprot:gnl/Spiro4/15085_TR8132_c0_g1_i1.p1 gnl/Spiro4/15085_TR8132_c0_g1~~gnl/Spiro4/15085_TR8132_c0_g1_i1.p1  ORF type:complete len:183 (-),score=18.22 gnl/Spiro4/15085_TR8132_c0_g1_i1:57-575(-)
MEGPRYQQVPQESLPPQGPPPQCSPSAPPSQPQQAPQPQYMNYQQAPPPVFHQPSYHAPPPPVYQAPPPVYQAPPPLYQQAAPVYVQPPQLVSVTPLEPFSRMPRIVVCPSCRNQVTTVIRYENGLLTYLSCVALAVTCICCFFVPFLADECKDAQHICPACGNLLGEARRL